MTPFQEVMNKFPFQESEREIKEKVEKILNNQAKYENREVYKQILSFIDLTSLNNTDNDESILKLVERVNRFGEAHPDVPNVAGICVFPCFTATVQSALEEDRVKNVAVAGGFPHAQTFSEIKVAETALSVSEGAEEIDTVMPIGLFKSADYDALIDELVEIKNACHGKILKIILETGALDTQKSIWEAALLCIYSGADFIKTSTGKVAQGATPEAVYTMCRAIKAYNSQFDLKIGIKVAGGISTTQEAVKYYAIVKEILGDEWLTPSLFRIGASRLVDHVWHSINEKEENY